MIEINLLPDPKKPDKDLQKILNPLVVYLTETSYEHAQLAKTEEEQLLWGKIWAGLLHLRKELLQPGYSPADNFARALVIDGSLDDFQDVFGNVD